MPDSAFLPQWLFFYGTLILYLALGLVGFFLPIRRSRRPGR